MNIAIGIGIFIGFAFVVAWLVYWISRAKGAVIDSPEDLLEKPKSSCCSADMRSYKNNTQTVTRCVRCGKICKTK